LSQKIAQPDLGVEAHGAELEEPERPPVFTLPVLNVEGGTGVDQLDSKDGERQNWQNHDAGQTGNAEIEQTAAGDRKRRLGGHNRRDRGLRFDHRR
jgi:hypothetical protein